MNHKYRKPKSSRSGCLLCKPHKLNAIKTSERMEMKRRVAKRIEEDAGILERLR